MVSVGLAYQSGMGTDKNPAKTKYWLDKAAAAGEPARMFYDGQLYAGRSSCQRSHQSSRPLHCFPRRRGTPWPCTLGIYFASEFLGGEQDMDAHEKWTTRRRSRRTPGR